MKTISFSILTLFAFLFFSCAVGQNPESYSIVSAEEFSTKTEQFPAAPILDVRTPEEYAEGHIPNALNMNWHGENFEQQIKNLDKTKPVFIYCQSGRRSKEAANKLAEEGFEQIYELGGGIMEWRENGMPVENK